MLEGVIKHNIKEVNVLSIRLIDKFIGKNDRVTVTRMGHITELQYMEKWVLLQS